MRKRREWYEGCSMHVMGRGVRRESIYNDGEDYEIFLKIVESTQEIMSFQLHSFCMMTNHFHMLITTQEKEIWHIMRRIMGNYAKYFNHKYGFKGHLFDSRYLSSITKNPMYFLEVSKYIHLNPVKAGIVNEPIAYPYSSYAALVSGKELKCLEREKVLGFFDGNREEQYRLFEEGE